VKPEEGFYEHVNCSNQIIAMADVTNLMSDDALQLCWRQTVEDAFRQQQDWLKNSKDARFQQSARGYCSYWYPYWYF
jgi:hypothetical protein